MNPSPVGEVRTMYDASADSYAAMMDAEIACFVYTDTLGRLSKRIACIPGSLIDTSCGSGHMLSVYRERFDEKRPLFGVDLSPRMVEISSSKLGASAEIWIGDMRELTTVATNSVAAVINFFSIHHLDSEGVRLALREWHRVLTLGGQLLLAAWEGVGTIDYGEDSNIVAFRFTSDEISSWVRSSGFVVDRCVVEPVDAISMDAVYLEATKQ